MSTEDKRRRLRRLVPPWSFLTRLRRPYLFLKTPEPDATAFCKKAMALDLLVVPGDEFGCPGYVRLAYCVPKTMLERSLPRFRQLADQYGLKK